jgi:hypothetical protein
MTYSFNEQIEKKNVKKYRVKIELQKYDNINNNIMENMNRKT